MNVKFSFVSFNANNNNTSSSTPTVAPPYWVESLLFSMSCAPMLIIFVYQIIHYYKQERERQIRAHARVSNLKVSRAKQLFIKITALAALLITVRAPDIDGGLQLYGWLWWSILNINTTICLVSMSCIVVYGTIDVQYRLIRRSSPRLLRSSLIVISILNFAVLNFLELVTAIDFSYGKLLSVIEWFYLGFMMSFIDAAAAISLFKMRKAIIESSQISPLSPSGDPTSAVLSSPSPPPHHHIQLPPSSSNYLNPVITSSSSSSSAAASGAITTTTTTTTTTLTTTALTTKLPGNFASNSDDNANVNINVRVSNTDVQREKRTENQSVLRSPELVRLFIFFSAGCSFGGVIVAYTFTVAYLEIRAGNFSDSNNLQPSLPYVNGWGHLIMMYLCLWWNRPPAAVKPRN